MILDQFERMLLIKNDQSLYAARLRLKIAILHLKREIERSILKVIKP